MEKQKYNQTNQPNDSQQEANTSTLSAGEKFWEELKAQGYDESKVGQAFIIHVPHSYNKPKKEIRRSLRGKK